MKPHVLFLILPLFVVLSTILIYILILEIDALLLGLFYIIIVFFVTFSLFKAGTHTPQSYFENISKNTIDVQKVEITFKDGVRSVGNFYRSVSETIDTPQGRRYPEPRPTIIFFHGFWNKKEVNERHLIPLAYMGYVAIAFDQRGHGEASGKKGDWYNMFNDVVAVLDLICSFDDVRKGSICCIGKSMGGTSVLTKAYQDERVAMVIGMSALHDVDLLLNHKFRFLSAGWFVRREISKADNKVALKIAAHHFLKENPKFNENRVYLIHAREDKIFPPQLTFKLNKKQAGVPDNHAILLNNCGHSLEGQESLVFGIILKWIGENKAMKLPSRKNS